MPRATGAWAATVVVLLAGFTPARGEGDAPAAVAAPAPAQAPAREIRVRIACDQEFRRVTGWERVARERLVAASAMFEATCGIRWTAADVVEWESPRVCGSMGEIVEGLLRDVPRAGADVVVGFTGRTGGLRSDNEFDALGIARYFGPAAVVRRDFPERSELEYVQTLAHELAHLLGVWHSDDPRSLMWVGGTRPKDAAFDRGSLAMIEITRELDFARGEAWIDEARARRIAEVYAGGHGPDSLLPHVSARMRDAWDLVCRPETLGAGREVYRRALVDQEACVGSQDPTLVPCAVKYAWSLLREPGRDVDAAERLVLRARSIAKPGRTFELAPLEVEELEAAVAIQRGRVAVARPILREVLAARRRALGTVDPATIYTSDTLNWCGREPRGAWAAALVVPWPQPGAATGAGDMGFDVPPAGRIHLRPAGLAAPWDDKPDDAVHEMFQVAVPAAGTLTLTFAESGQAGASARRIVARVPEPSSYGKPVLAGYAFRRTAAGRYVVELHVRPSDDVWTWRVEAFERMVPSGAGVRFDRTLIPPAGSRFLSVPDGGEEIRRWFWVPGRAGSRIVVHGDAEAGVDGVRVAPDGTGTAQTWRLTAAFRPDAPK